ncbi:asparaginyl-tRNA synthetase [Xylaria intraflava]|nr:asparaginyl-tRNA synthetase [Xylaria intraflava]
MSTVLSRTRGAFLRACPNHFTISTATPRAFISTSLRNISNFLDLKPDGPIENVEVQGYVRSVRAQKRFHFVSLGDGSSLGSLQAIVPADRAAGLTVGAAVRLAGSWVPSQGRSQSHELQVSQATVLGPSDAKTFPIQKKYQTPEFLRSLPHLRSRIPFNSTVLRFRSEVIASLTSFFNNHQFIQTHPPILTSSDCEGAGEVFHVLGGNERDASSAPAKPFFRRPVYTTVSSQLHLEALAQGLGNVWTLSPTFRAEQSDTPRHLSEFYMLEAELGFTESQSAVMDLVEDMLKHVASSLSDSKVVGELLTPVGDRSPDLASADQVSDRWRGLTQDNWPRITYTEAVRLLEVADVPFTHKPSWGEDLRTEHEKFIAAKVGKGLSPVFVTNYPRDIKAFYMRASNTDGDLTLPRETVDCFDLLVPEFCEIAGGSMREHRLEQLIQSMSARGLYQMPSSETDEKTTQEANNNLDWYIDLRRWGCPPHGGFGLGFDRLMCYLTGVQTIHDTTAFPRWYGRCDC